MSKSFQSQPLRYQVRERLIEFILQRGYRPGDQLPAEGELGELLKVSRFSLREALLLLEDERVISTRHGSGRYLVTIPNEYQIDLTSLQSVTELLASYDIQATNRVLRLKEIVSSREVSANLQIEINTPVLSIERLRIARETPIIYSVDFIKKANFPEGWGEQDLTGSLFDYLENNAGVILDRSQSTVRSTLLPEEIDTIMGKPKIAWILLEQVIFDRQGEPVIYSKDYHRGDYILFHVRRYRR